MRNKLRAKNGDVGWKIRVVSRTNFPVAAGLASSAAGFAAIACGIGRALNFSNAEVARLARIGDLSLIHIEFQTHRKGPVGLGIDLGSNFADGRGGAIEEASIIVLIFRLE